MECPTIASEVERGIYDDNIYYQPRRQNSNKADFSNVSSQKSEPRTSYILERARFYCDRCHGFKCLLFIASCAASVVYAMIQMVLSIQWIHNGALNPLLSHQVIIALFTLAVTIQATFRFVSATDEFHFATIQLLTTLFLTFLFTLFTLVGTIEQMIPDTYSGPLAQPKPTLSFSKDTSSSTPWIKEAEIPLTASSTEPGTFLIVFGLLSLLFPVQNVVVLRYVLQASEMRRPVYRSSATHLDDSAGSEGQDQTEMIFN
ncbi:hypothetical protein D915_004730 [Fasciola hepatica]|uniref:Transmembrane protein n=1 Tax=Fasciola hepatica TaxID=6192 RepID=A0A4E0RDU6_FASHE|nr:hypothetical protein D915_004730 [Fasciola hepatica]